MATDPIFCPSVYCVRMVNGYYRPFVMEQVVYEMLVDTRVVHESHWRQPPPPTMMDFVRRAVMRGHFPPPPPYPHPDDTYILEVD
jgi:hypothetical protein